MPEKIIKQHTEYTFKYNKSLGRHGWLRLTPAYSVKLVDEILSLNSANKSLHVFDPFSGTGTTGLVAAQKGFNASLFDINPFLVWLAKQKCRNYSKEEIRIINKNFHQIIIDARRLMNVPNWIPSIFNIHRWWDEFSLKCLAALRAAITKNIGEPRDDDNSQNILWVCFCRLVIETSSASFNHVSMSFSDQPIKFEFDLIINLFEDIFRSIIASCDSTIVGKVNIQNSDSRNPGNLHNVDLVITSPPYPNRISYIRELRPYMYWLRFLIDGKESGELDWQTIGGTWGIATSRLSNWEPCSMAPDKAIENCIKQIRETENKNSEILSIYVKKYFFDIELHLKNLYSSLNDSAKIFYIVGNSYFFGVNVDTSRFYMNILERTGFLNIQSTIIRKRNSNKGLFEYCISAEKG